MDTIITVASSALVILGVAVMTIGVYGIIRMPDVYTKLHAASKAVFLGVIGIALASFVTGNRDIVLRVILISIILLLTTPVASHVIGRAAYLEHERMETPGAVDESETSTQRSAISAQQRADSL